MRRVVSLGRHRTWVFLIQNAFLAVGMVLVLAV
jgi:hypothetical protein